jgi:hypothetical protein
MRTERPFQRDRNPITQGTSLHIFLRGRATACSMRKLLGRAAELLHLVSTARTIFTFSRRRMPSSMICASRASLRGMTVPTRPVVATPAS